MKFSEDKAIELEFDERKALLDGIKHDEEEHNPGNIVALEPDVVEVDFELEEIEKQEAVRSKEEEKRQLEASDEFRKKHGLTSGGSRVQVQQTIDSFSGFKYLEMNDFIVEDEDMKEVLDRETNSGEAIPEIPDDGSISDREQVSRDQSAGASADPTTPVNPAADAVPINLDDIHSPPSSDDENLELAGAQVPNAVVIDLDDIPSPPPSDDENSASRDTPTPANNANVDVDAIPDREGERQNRGTGRAE